MRQHNKNVDCTKKEALESGNGNGTDGTIEEIEIEDVTVYSAGEGIKQEPDQDLPREDVSVKVENDPAEFRSLMSTEFDVREFCKSMSAEKRRAIAAELQRMQEEEQ